MTPIIRHGYKQYITEDNLWDLAKQDTARAAVCKEKPSLWVALFRRFGAAYAQGALFKAIADVLAILQPQLLWFFILFMDSYQSYQPQPFTFGAAIALSMFAVSRLSQTGVKKSLRLSNEARGTKSTGDIVNLMAVDSQRLQDITHIFTGVALIIVTIPINRNTRSKLTAEVIANIKSIKLFAWGSAFANRIVSSFIGSVTPFLVAYSAFAVRVLVQRQPLTTEIVFPAIALFQLLTSPLMILPAAISSITEANVAVNRLAAFFTTDKLQPDAVIREEAVTVSGEESSMHGTGTALQDINLSAHRGELCCLVGCVGAGKSSILHALLGDLYKATGTVTLRGSVAYVAQQPWVLNASVRDNITFGKLWDPDFYVETVKACALIDDLAQLPNGDQTEVGDKGITLTRAVYARADINLLDNCLSAVDQHVGRHLIEEVFSRRGLLKNRTRILATNSTPVLLEANSIVLIRNRKISEQGIYNQLKAKGGDFVSLIGHANNSNQIVTESTTTRPSYAEEGTTNNQQQLGHDKTSKATGMLTPGQSSAVDGNTSIPANIDPRRIILDVEAAISKPKRCKELTQQGSVKWKVYGDYAKASSLWAVALYAVTLVGAQVAEIGGNVWLKQWSEANDDPNADADVKKYLGIYALFSLAVISSRTPAFILLAIPLIFVYSYIQQYYLGAKRELKCLDGSKRRLDANIKVYILSITANRWLGMQLEFIGSIIILSAAGLTLACLSLGSYLSAGIVSLIISYILQITQSLNSLIRATGEVEINIVSAKRVLEYTHLPSEALDVIPNHRPGISWPSRGSVSFIDYSMRYRPELGLVLRNLNLNFKLGENISIVGYTGAGKSSLALAVFRIIKPLNGSIYIDDIDISKIDPALFKGTVRENLDPGEEHDNMELWTALRLARLKEYKQLVSLAYTMLKPTSILVLDKATAAVDIEIDMHLQEILRESIFSNRTVITIAHRINTIIDSDRIVVLEKGEAVEFDTPATLMLQKGAFYQLVKEAGLLERLG
ncbi:P-loop containing nucleoside triphosphate hydrolase protein [Ilyonectria robusta]|uniref:P-loop containing nucleoside triphosphate hydrolase protein n=1 Tax=Ilyonectria robusta TaxID=1079257 RepID=UPI001E8D4F42|nr:P-loop containing nucleoside triphosphate hydrolase protein [Ilyonectria robusta]KAH8651800.1 P-loop containing nucleoside triphosphate hydrolase protein [Ilyonectria robusta]